MRKPSHLNRDLCLDGGPGIVVLQGEVLVLEAVDVLHGGIDLHYRQRARLAAQLEFGLLQVVRVKVQVAESVDELAGLQVADLGDHHGEQGVAGDVEGHAEEQVSATLVELAGEPALIHEELKHEVAGRQRHFLDVRHVPRAHDMAPGVGIGFDAVDHVRDLVVLLAIRAFPASPLRAVHGTQVAFFIRPFVPDGDLVLVQVLNVGIALQKPEQFMDDAAQVQLLRGQAGESRGEVVARLLAEDGRGAHTRAVLPETSVVQDLAQQAVVFVHGGMKHQTGSCATCGAEVGADVRRL